MFGPLFFRGGIDLFPSLIQTALDAFSFRAENVFQAFLEVVYHRVHVVLLHLLAAAVLQLLHDVPEAGNLLTVPVLETLTQHLPKGAHDIALVHDFIGEPVHQLFSV